MRDGGRQVRRARTSHDSAQEPDPEAARRTWRANRPTRSMPPTVWRTTRQQSCSCCPSRSSERGLSQVPDSKTICLAKAYSQEHKCDVLLCSGPIDEQLDDGIHACLAQKRHPNLLLILATSGGDAHVAYRIARHLQRAYGHIYVCVAGWCKSAGTLLTACGNELIMGDRGELGPIDVQVRRTDDLWESTSGLTESTALSTLQAAAWSMLGRFVIDIKSLSGGNITFKAAAEAAGPLVSELLKPIYEQIDPLKLGENSRSLKIATEYLNRINEHSQNLATESDDLVWAYPDHGFVIDRKEAKQLFKEVGEPDQNLLELCDTLGDVVLHPDNRRLILLFLDQVNGKGEADGEESELDDSRAEADPKADGSVPADRVQNDGSVLSDGEGRSSHTKVEPSQPKERL